MQKLVKKEYQIPFILVTSLFFLWGFAHAILDVLNKHFQDVMNISRAHSAWVQVMFYLGYFVMGSGSRFDGSDFLCRSGK